MEILLFSANCILPIILVMAVGYGLRRLNFVSDSFVSQANQFCFKVTLPVQLFCNIYKQEMKLEGGGLIAFAAIAIVAVAGILCILALSFTADLRLAYMLAVIIGAGNCCFGFIPGTMLLRSWFGIEAKGRKVLLAASRELLGAHAGLAQQFLFHAARTGGIEI